MKQRTEWLEDGGMFHAGDLVRQEQTGETVCVIGVDETLAMLEPSYAPLTSLLLRLWSPERERSLWLAEEGLLEPVVKPWRWAVWTRCKWRSIPRTRLGWGIAIGQRIGGHDLDVPYWDEDD